MSAQSDDPNEPVILRKESPYHLVRAANLGRPAGEATTGEFKELREEEIIGVPGAEWLYKDYTDTHLLYLRVAHTLLYLVEVAMFVLSVYLSDGSYLIVTTHTMTPFTLNPKFVFTGWIIVLALEGLFVLVSYKKTLTAVELLAQQLSWYLFPKYVIISTYFFIMYDDALAQDIVDVVLLAVLFPLIHFIYHRVKYQDDGRFLVTRLEFIAVHVNISVYAGWVQIRLLHEIFSLVTYYNTGKILGWDDSHWSVLANVLMFCIGVIYLSSYKDVFFNVVIIYAYIGIEVEQSVCSANVAGDCTSEIKKTVLILGVILTVFVLLIFVLYRNQILYRRRS